MLKRLVILAVVLSVASAFVPATGQASNKGTQDRKDKSQPANASTNPSPTTTPIAAQYSSGDSLKSKSDSGPDDHQQAAINISNSAAVTEWTWHDKVAWFFGLVLTGFLVWGVIVARGTLKAIQEQTEETARAARAAKDGAEASLANTRALVAAERAWIVVSVESPVPNRFQFRATNVGKTPAKVTSIWSCPLIQRRGEELQVPPDDQTGESLVSTPPCLLPPTDSTIVFRCSNEDLYIPGDLAKDALEAGRKYIARGIWSAYSYGRIRYFDVVDADLITPHETEWLYWHMPIENSMPAINPKYSEYNRYIDGKRRDQTSKPN